MPKAGRPSGQIKTGGRKKGALNKTTAQLIEKLDGLGIDLPKRIYKCVESLEELEKTGDPMFRLQLIRAESDIYLELMQYVYPKRKAVELTDPNGENPFKSLTDLVKELASDNDSQV